MANMALSEQILWENWCPVFPKGLIPHIFPVTLWLWLTVRHGIDGPNRNRWFTELKNGWIFPWRIRSSHNQMVLDGHRWGIHGYPLFTMSTILKPTTRLVLYVRGSYTSMQFWTTIHAMMIPPDSPWIWVFGMAWNHQTRIIWICIGLSFRYHFDTLNHFKPF